MVPLLMFSLPKFWAIAKKLRYLPNSKAVGTKSVLPHTWLNEMYVLDGIQQLLISELSSDVS
jgi:hypothetical protein